MKRYILTRVAQAVLCIIAVSVIVFLLSRLTGDPLDLLLPIDATEQDRAILSKELGLDKPLVAQYFIFIGNALKGDFGDSVASGIPTTTVVRERIPATAQLAASAMFISLLISVPIGVYSARRRGGVFDFMARMLAVLGPSSPCFFVGIILIYFLAVTQGWLPVAGREGWTLKFLVLPSMALGWGISAGIMRLTRSSMLEVLDADYVKLARIKGVSEFKVTWKHAFKNAAIPVLTYSAVIFAILLGGTVVIEQVFAWPGVGQLVVESVTRRDFPIVQTVVMLLCTIFIFTNLVVDILYGYLNPKIRYER